VTTHAPLRSRRTKAASVSHVQVLCDGDAPTSPLKDTRLEGVGCRVEPVVTHPAPPTDPYVRNARIRFLRQSCCCPSTVHWPSVVRGGELYVSSLSLASGCSARRRLPSRGSLGPSFPTFTGTMRRYDCHRAPLGSLRLSLASRYLACFSRLWCPRRARCPVEAPRQRQGLWSPGPPLRV